MAVTKTVRSKQPLKSPGDRFRPNSTARNSKKPKAPPPKQQKTKRALPNNKPKKHRTYTDEELGIPKLNTITPAGVQKPKGKKKGKIFIDDADSMMTILAMVNADKEGQIESKMMKARQMEEIREARRKEADNKEEKRKARLEDAKDAIRKKKTKRQPDGRHNDEIGDQLSKRSTKRVAFA